MRNKPWLQSTAKSHIRHQRIDSYCIFTEYETEQLYLTSFRLPNLQIKCVGLGGGTADHLLNECLSQMKTAKYSGFDHYWLVFDKDDNSPDIIYKVIRTAEKRKIHWCFSNPCFEIWILLHFCFRNTPTSPEELKRRLIPQFIKGYSETYPKLGDTLAEHQHQAMNNAMRLLPETSRVAWRMQPSNANPSTNLDELIRLLAP